MFLRKWFGRQNKQATQSNDEMDVELVTLVSSVVERLENDVKNFKVCGDTKFCTYGPDGEEQRWAVKTVDEDLYLDGMFRWDGWPAASIGVVKGGSVIKVDVSPKGKSGLTKRLADAIQKCINHHRTHKNSLAGAEAVAVVKGRTPVAVSSPVLQMTEHIDHDKETADLRDKILALPDEEAQISDSLSAMQYGLRVQRMFADATAAFTNQTMAGADSLAGAGAAFDRLIADLTGSRTERDSDGPMTFSKIRTRLDVVKGTLDTALDQVLKRYGNVSQAADLFEACTTALEKLVVNGEILHERAGAENQLWAGDLADALASLRMNRTVSEFQKLTVARVMDVERESVNALRRLSVNTLPLLGTQVCAAAILEQAQSARTVAEKADEMDRAMLPGLVAGGGSLEDLRDQLVQQFTQARDTLAGVKVNLEEARTLVLKQAGSATPRFSGAPGDSGQLQYEAG